VDDTVAMTVADPIAQKSRVLRHILVPAIAPAAIVGLYFTPVDLIGCANRGLLALAVAAVSTLAAFVTIATGIGGRGRGDQRSLWWVVTTLILTLPALLLLGPLG
jgi:hypothetical protein